MRSFFFFLDQIKQCLTLIYRQVSLCPQITDLLYPNRVFKSYFTDRTKHSQSLATSLPCLTFIYLVCKHDSIVYSHDIKSLSVCAIYNDSGYTLNNTLHNFYTLIYFKCLKTIYNGASYDFSK